MLKPRGIVFDVQPLGDIGWITVIFGVSYDKLMESDAVFYGYFNISRRAPVSAIRSCCDMQGRCAAFLTENDSRIANGGDGIVIGGPNCSEIRIGCANGHMRVSPEIYRGVILNFLFPGIEQTKPRSVLNTDRRVNLRVQG